jgi:formamidopyrimidine-DNA glycosylase
MPEAVEVKKYCDMINRYVGKKKLLSVKILAGRYKTGNPPSQWTELKRQLPLKLLSVNSKGKFIYWTFERDVYLFNTLGLMGGWTFFDTEYRFPRFAQYAGVQKDWDQAVNHLKIQFTFETGKLYFFDQLSFGTIDIRTNPQDLTDRLKRLGPDILDQSTDQKIFKSVLTPYSNEPIGLVLVNQSIVSGIGNYLRADALWVAEISPYRKVKSLSNVELNRLFRTCRALVWGEYNYRYAVLHGIVSARSMLPWKHGRTNFVYGEKQDMYGNPITREPLHEGSQKRFIYWVKLRQK